MKKSIIGLTTIGLLALGLVACNGSTTTLPNHPGGGLATPLPNNPPTSTQSYIQIELLARPAVKEVFENFNDHKTTNAVEPYAGSPADPLDPADPAALTPAETRPDPPTGASPHTLQ